MTPHEKAILIEVLIYHQRLDIGHCACGWGKDPKHLGLSHAKHVVEVYEIVLNEKGG